VLYLLVDKKESDRIRVAGNRAAAHEAGFREKTLWLLEGYHQLVDELMRRIGWATASARAARAQQGKQPTPEQVEFLKQLERLIAGEATTPTSTPPQRNGNLVEPKTAKAHAAPRLPKLESCQEELRFG